MKEIVNTLDAPAAIGPYSQGILWQNLVFTSGQIPLHPQSGEVVANDIKAQARQTLDNLMAVLDRSGSSLDCVIKTTCFLTSMDDFVAFNKVYTKYFEESLPARSCVAVRELPKGVLCEVEAIAYVKA